MNRKRIALLVLLVATAPLAGRASEPMELSPRVADAITLLDLWIGEQVAYRNLPGLSIGIVHDQELIWAQGYGFSDPESRTPATPETVYRIGSVTKLFTATAIMQLRDRGKLRLDDPVARHLPGFKVLSPFPDAPAITIRHLLTHTSGLPREGAFPYWTTHEFPSRDEILAALPGQTAVHPPGETYKYSNLGMALLGQIVAAVSGESYPDYVRKTHLRAAGHDQHGGRCFRRAPEPDVHSLHAPDARRPPQSPRLLRHGGAWPRRATSSRRSPISPASPPSSSATARPGARRY